MMSMEERQTLKLLTEMLNQQNEKTSNIDVSNRARDEKGRFTNEKEEESELESDNYNLSLTKIRGTYGTYKVKRWEPMTIGDVAFVIGLFLLYKIALS